MADSPPIRSRLPNWRKLLLATVVLVVAGIGLFFWWPDHREQKVIQKIKSWGGSVETEKGSPAWFLDFEDHDPLKEFKVVDRIVGVQLAGTAVTDSDVRCLRNLTKLRRLSLDGTAVTDRGMAILCGLTKNESYLVNLEYLSCRDTAVTDNGIERFRKDMPDCKIVH